MKYAGGTIDEGAVKAAGGQVLPDGSGVRVGGWNISTGHGPITADADLEKLKDGLGTLAAPEQFYGANFLRLRHDATGTVVSFTALDALKGWLQDKSERVRVGESDDWLASRREDVEQHAAQTLEYDWTFTTSYAGSLERDGASSSSGGDGSSSSGSAAAPPAAAAADGGNDGSSAAAGAQAAAQGGSAAGPLPKWQASSEQIPRALLTSRDPILFYDELPLYESELDDHGSSRVSLKMRVMPRCWYVLLRFWLRVDRVMVRLRETRLFCQFDGPSAGAVVLREVKYHEGTFEALRAAGAPAEGPLTRMQELCTSAPPPPAPANGFGVQSLGELKRVQTETVDWGYYRFGNASSPRPPLLLIPGFGSTVSAWPLDFLARLAADQEVVMVDNRGQGFTQDLDPTARLSIPGLANDTMEFVRALGLDQPPNVLGWSMGGMIATALVAQHSDELGKVTAVAGSAGGLEATPPSDLATAVLTSPNSTEVQHLALGYALDTPAGVQAACDYGAATHSTVQSPSNNTTTGQQLAAILNYLIFDDSVWELLPVVDNEVLLVVGREDQVVPADNSRAMATRLQRPWLVLLEGGHAAFLQHQPVFLQVLDAFLTT